MLFRGQNILGYRHYSDDVVEYFVQKSIANGIDILRIFDALNDPRNLRTAINATKKEGGHVQAAFSYTTGPVYTLEYYSQYAKQLRSEFLAQLQGIESYGKDTGNILFLICATNKPWDIDSAFLRHGRFGTKIYVGLPDEPARKYMINKRLDKIRAKGVVTIKDDIDMDSVMEQTNGFNGSDITNLLDRIEEISIIRGIRTGEKFIGNDDFTEAMKDVRSSVQLDDIAKLKEWRQENDS
jgi:SpoVK/Ycf46/Vps4 family AAA+-type ATPase